MFIDLVLAKREYVLEKGIIDKTEIALISVLFIGTDSNNQAIFEISRNGTTIPETWVLKKYDVSSFTGFVFPKGVGVTPITVANFINNKTNLG